ncbi:MAG: hypothetical protein KDC79_11220 [Cyclobacteriaceae bacterium]|nr:hypothetical protein [Cyclobacteriaceae bacterium]
MKKLLPSVFLFISCFSFGQTTEVLEESNNSIGLSETKEFHCVPQEVHLSDAYKRAVLKGTVTNNKKQTIVDIFNDFWKKSNEMGANAFHIDSVQYHSIVSIKFTITVYSLSETQIDSIYMLYPTNKIYILGDLNPEALKFKPITIKVNNIKTELPPTKYLSYQNKIDGETIISKGGLMGTKVWIRWKEDRLPLYLSVNGFGVGPGSSVGVMGISFNTGRINSVDMNFGEFLIETLEIAN